jgi:hypothetical protein
MNPEETFTDLAINRLHDHSYDRLLASDVPKEIKLRRENTSGGYRFWPDCVIYPMTLKTR